MNPIPLRNDIFIKFYTELPLKYHALTNYFSFTILETRDKVYI
jgi:hypothetical protein